MSSTPAFYSYYRVVVANILCSNSDNLVVILEWDLYASSVQPLLSSATATVTGSATPSPSPSITPSVGTSRTPSPSSTPSATPSASAYLVYPPQALTGYTTQLTSATFANGNYTGECEGVQFTKGFVCLLLSLKRGRAHLSLACMSLVRLHFSREYLRVQTSNERVCFDVCPPLPLLPDLNRANTIEIHPDTSRYIRSPAAVAFEL